MKRKTRTANAILTTAFNLIQEVEIYLGKIVKSFTLLLQKYVCRVLAASSEEEITLSLILREKNNNNDAKTTKCRRVVS